MIRTAIRLVWLALGTSCLFAMPAASADHYGTATYRPSREDLQELAALAPPARASTENATYGDAPLVRSRGRFRHHVSARDMGADAPLGLYFCPRRRDEPGRGLCVRDPRRVGFRDFYRYTPAYATAPQVPRDGFGRESSLLPPATRFFYSANAALFGNPTEDRVVDERDARRGQN